MNSIRTMVLTDCSNAHAAIRSTQPKSAGRSTKILLDYVRDHLPYLCISFVDTGHNIADTGTKLTASREPWCQLIHNNGFKISFMGRKLLKETQATRITAISYSYFHAIQLKLTQSSSRTL